MKTIAHSVGVLGVFFLVILDRVFAGRQVFVILDLEVRLTAPFFGLHLADSKDYRC